MARFEYESPSDVFPSTIRTGRLLFKRVSYDILDVRKMYELYSAADVTETQFVTFTPHSSIHETREWMDASIEKFDTGKSAGYFLFETDKNGNPEDFIGTAGFTPSWEKSIAESGIFLFEEYWGNEYSSERGEAMLSLAFEELDFEWWISKCHPDNTGSERAIEKYVVGNGGERVGVLPNFGLGITDSESADDLLYFKLSQESYLSERS